MWCFYLRCSSLDSPPVNNVGRNTTPVVTTMAQMEISKDLIKALDLTGGDRRMPDSFELGDYWQTKLVPGFLCKNGASLGKVPAIITGS